jgi:VWFA-related protein
MKYPAVALIVLLFLAAGAVAQAPSAPKGSPELTLDSPITLDVTRVNILYTVTDRKGRFVKSLTRDDFEITENKKKQNILEFTAETDLPLRIALLIDTSNSIRDRFRFLQDAAINFINTAMRPNLDRAMIVTFDTQAQLNVGLTTDKTLLDTTVRRLRPGGGTAMNDAIALASETLMQDQPRDKYRRAIILLSDGEDNLSRFSRAQAIEFAHKADTVIYGVSTNITHLESAGDKVLKYLAQETGGLAIFPFKIEDLDQSFVNVLNELRNQYNVLYRPEPMFADGKYHSVDIRVKTAGDYIVRARQGYYAPAPIK